jgi:putative ABC transport system permease protein
MLHGVSTSLRSLAKQPAFTLVAVAVLALGIGANTAIFSVLDAVLIRPLPFRDPGRLVVVWERNVPRDRRTNVASPANFLAWRDAQQSFTDLAAVTGVPVTVNLTGTGEPEELRTQLVTASLFPLLGVRAAVGRTFLPEEDAPGAAPAVLLSHRLWARRFGSDPALVGGAITLDGRARTVVGIMPAGFQVLDETIDVWLPMAFPAAARTAGGRYLLVLGRLKPGVDVAAAQAGMDTITTRLARDFPGRDAGWASNVVSLHQQIVGGIRPALLVLAGAVAFVLLIACANVANLLLARATGRRRELAVRAALGAGRGHLVRLLVGESLALAVLGGAAGLGLAYAGLRVLVASAVDQLAIPRLAGAGLNLPVLLFTLAASLAAGLVFGLAPAFAASRFGLADSLKEGARGSDARSGRLRAALVVAEVALSLALLAGAGLLFRSFERLLSVSPGFRTEHVLTMRVSLPSRRYRDEAARVRFFRELTGRIERLPGVTAAGGISFLPLDGPGAATSYGLPGRPDAPAGEQPVADVRAVSGDYFRAMGIPLLEGRTFTDHDTGDAADVVVINETMARQCWPNEDPIGKHVDIHWSDDVTDEVVGVVGDVKVAALDDEPRATAYWPHARQDASYGSLTLVVRAAGDPASLTSAVVGQVHEMDPLQPVSKVRTMEDVVSRSVAARRLVMLLLAIFAAAAAALAAIGLYGVISYVVAGRTREIGVRLAIGARPADVVRQVVGQAMALVGIGVLAGLAGALALTRLMGSLLFEVRPSDPATFAAVVVLMTLVGVAASLMPAWRASRVDPVRALRAE